MEELEIMRQQLASMKQQLDSQQIINRDLLRKLMSKKASWLNSFVYIEILIIPVIYLFFEGIADFFGMSPWYALSYVFMAAIDVAFDWYAVRIPKSKFSTSSVLELRKFLISQKKVRFLQMIIGIPLVLLWFILFGWGCLSRAGISGPVEVNSTASCVLVGGGIVGVALGIALVIYIYRKMQKTNDALLKDIRQLEDGK